MKLIGANDLVGMPLIFIAKRVVLYLHPRAMQRSMTLDFLSSHVKLYLPPSIQVFFLKKHVSARLKYSCTAHPNYESTSNRKIRLFQRHGSMMAAAADLELGRRGSKRQIKAKFTCIYVDEKLNNNT